MPAFGRSEDGMADDRIAHILSEASSMIKPSQQQQHHLAQQQQHLQQHHMLKQHDDSMNSNDDSKSPPNQCTSPFSRDSQNRRLKKYDNDDIPHDKVTRIYQEELAKLMGRGSRDSFPRYVMKFVYISIDETKRFAGRRMAARTNLVFSFHIFLVVGCHQHPKCLTITSEWHSKHIIAN